MYDVSPVDFVVFRVLPPAPLPHAGLLGVLGAHLRPGILPRKSLGALSLGVHLQSLIEARCVSGEPQAPGAHQVTIHCIEPCMHDPLRWLFAAWGWKQRCKMRGSIY